MAAVKLLLSKLMAGILKAHLGDVYLDQQNTKDLEPTRLELK